MRSVLARGATLVLVLGLVAFGTYASIVGFIQPQYNAVVGTCLGGRGNLCDVTISYQGRQVLSRSYVETSGPGDHITVTASGRPPWSRVDRISIGRWIVVSVTFGAAGFIIVMWWLIRRTDRRRGPPQHEKSGHRP